jgi:hypothetical protein
VIPVLWVISGYQELNALAVDPEVLGIPVPRDVSALAGCFWGEDAIVLVTTRSDGISLRHCDFLLGHVTPQEAALVESALAELVS